MHQLQAFLFAVGPTLGDMRRQDLVTAVVAELVPLARSLELQPTSVDPSSERSSVLKTYFYATLDVRWAVAEALFRCESLCPVCFD